MPGRFEKYRVKKCRHCGRRLTAEESIERGFGATCAIEFAKLWATKHPTYLGPRARRFWTKQEITKLAHSHLRLVSEGR